MTQTESEAHWSQCYWADMMGAAWAERDAAIAKSRPSVLFRPDIGRDGNKWSVLYGSNLMEGIAGFGDTVEEAMADFDKNWHEQQVHVAKLCLRCKGTGAVDTPFSGSDPSCPNCGGTGVIE